MSSGGDSCSTIGYRYFAGLHLIFCHAADKLLSIGVGEKVAWEGEVTENATLQINKPQLFGGDDREGGVVGAVDVCFGLPTQAKNSYLQSILGANIPAFRGIFGLIANRCQLSALNPYIKPWWIIAQRTETGWESDLAEIVAPDGYVDMNPAHIIREALTNSTWGGLGYPEADLDDDSFQAAAYTLGQGDNPNQEAIGLSFLWAKNTSIDDFIGAMLQCIDGVLFFSHITGLLTLKLVRNDYTPAMLPVFDASNILELVEYSAPTATEAVNQVTVVWVDRNNTARGSTVHDVAGIDRANGQTIPLSIEFPGVTNEELALKLAARELQQVCVPLASCTLLVNRKNWGLEPGDCFVLNWAPIGLSGVVFRVTSVEVGLHTEGQLRIKAARDVYGLGPVALTEPAESLWSSPYSAPADAVYRNVQEITWWQFVRAYGESEAVLAELTDDSTGVICFCGRPSPDAINYEMWSRNTGETDYTKRDTDSFPFIGTTAAALDPEVSSTIALQQSYIDTNLVKVGQYAALGDELVAVTAIDSVNVTVTVDRGILDTIPVSHAAGETIWFYQGLFGLDQTPRAAGEQVEVKILSSTTQGRLEIDDAATNTKTLEGRMMRPYPPGNVKLNGSAWPSSIDAASGLTVTWSHRDRTLQTVTLNRQDDGSIGPEAGVTYSIRIYDNDDALIGSEDGLTGTSYALSGGGTLTDEWFNPEDHDSHITISGDNNEIASNDSGTGWFSARGFHGFDSGKWYFEFEYTDFVLYAMFGVAAASASINTHIGASSVGWGYNGNGGAKFNAGVSNAYGESLMADGLVVGVAIDMDAGKIWWSKDGVWQASGDPANGTGEAYSNLTGTVYPAISAYSVGTDITLRMASEEMTYTPPDGFSVLTGGSQELADSVRVELWAERDGLTSLQKWNISTPVV